MTSKQAVIEKIFSYDLFKGLDREALLARYDTSAALHEMKSGLRLWRGQTLQTSTTIDSIPPQGIVITQPGTYTFAKDITWKAPSESCAAITIVCNNVTLDLATYSLKAIVQDTGQQIVGILVQGAEGITVQNGLLVNMCFYGICAEGVRNLAIQDVTVTGVTFTNLALRNACPAGIHIDGGEGVTLTNCVVQYMYVTSDSSAGIQIVNTYSGQVTGCRVSNLINYDGSGQGYSYIGSAGIMTTDCVADTLVTHFNGNIQTLGHTAIGFVPIFCVDLAYIGCSASNITGCCDDAHGMSVFVDALVEVDNFTATNVLDGPAPYNTGAKATGLEVYGADIRIRNCSVSNIQAINPQDRQSAGFSVWGDTVAFEGCTAFNVTVIDQAGGETPARGVGFGWAPDPRSMFCKVGATSVTYTQCTASQCDVGFDSWYHVNSTWQKLTYTGCPTTILKPPQNPRTISGDPGSECNPPISVTLTDIAANNQFPPS